MKRASVLQMAVAICVMVLLPAFVRAQVTNASLSGVVTDPAGLVVPKASMQLKAVDTGEIMTFNAGTDGVYAFTNLLPNVYDLKVSAQGFRDYVQSGITLGLNEHARADVKLEMGTSVQTVEIHANASPLNFENAVQEGGVSPATLDRLPLVMGQINRNIASFVVLLPGVTTSGGDNRSGFDTRINGGMLEEDEAILDGVTMEEGGDSASGLLVTTADHPISPEMASEFKEITSNYQPQYGSTSSGVLVAITKSGTNEFHGSFFEYFRNTVLDARSWSAVTRSPNKQNDFGGNVGGPLNFIPGLKHFLWNGNKKTYFFVNYELYRGKGGTQANILSLPTAQERIGDFSDWVNSSGNLIPIYDPDTTRVNPNYNPNLPTSPTNLPQLRDQFMGCDGNSPNVICPTDPRMQASLAPQWIKFLPTLTYPNKLLNNYVVPSPVSQFVAADSTLLDIRGDHYVGEKDHFAYTLHYFGTYGNERNLLPKQIDDFNYRQPNYGDMSRINYDHTFRPNLLNNLNLGWNNFYSKWRSSDEAYTDTLPKIPGVAVHDLPPVITFGEYQGFGTNGVIHETRPTYVANDMVSWVKGMHTIRFGGEIRFEGLNNTTFNNESGTFNFSDLNTGLLGLQSGNSFASFLLGDVDTGSTTITTVPGTYARQRYLALHIGDTWKFNRKLTLDYGLRWDVATPAREKYDHYSFIDPNKPNPGANNLPGALVFAGNNAGAASAGRPYPESTWYKGFGPRFGVAYAVTTKTVVRAGYAVIFSKLFYPGYSGGIRAGQDGYNRNVQLSSTNGGMTPALLLQNGLPTDYTPPPYLNLAFDNGQVPNFNTYRDPNGGRRPYSQMWNLTIEHQFTPNTYIDVAYVANRGTHLLSQVTAINDLNPSLLSMGPALNDEFTPGETILDGVSIPYAGWVEQMQSCPASVAQALLPYPQFCSRLHPVNEQDGVSNFQSLQIKMERRFSRGLWFTTAYTNEKWMSDTQDVQGWGAQNVSPFQRSRNKALALSDIPQTLSVALTYDLPLGKGKRYLKDGSVANDLLGGWQLSTIFRINSGVPIPIRDSLCNVPGEFGSSCIPGVLPGADPYAQHGSFDPNNPLFNKSAFEQPQGFNFYTGVGNPIGHLRTLAYRNNDITLEKVTSLGERIKLGIYLQGFNAWNWHCFTAGSIIGPGSPFYTDTNSPLFGMQTGITTTPRNIQFGARIQY